MVAPKQPVSAPTQALVEAGDEPDARLHQRADDGVQIVRLDPHVAVGNHQHLVLGDGHHVGDVADLVIAAGERAVDHQGDVDAGQIGDDLAGDRDRGIGLAMGADHDLQRSVIGLAAERAEILIQARIGAAHRLQDRDGGALAGHRHPLPAERPDGDDGNDQIEDADQTDADPHVA